MRKQNGEAFKEEAQTDERSESNASHIEALAERAQAARARETDAPTPVTSETAKLTAIILQASCETNKLRAVPGKSSTTANRARPNGGSDGGAKRRRNDQSEDRAKRGIEQNARVHSIGRDKNARVFAEAQAVSEAKGTDFNNVVVAQIANRVIKPVRRFATSELPCLSDANRSE